MQAARARTQGVARTTHSLDPPATQRLESDTLIRETQTERTNSRIPFESVLSIRTFPQLEKEMGTAATHARRRSSVDLDGRGPSRTSRRARDGVPVPEDADHGRPGCGLESVSNVRFRNAAASSSASLSASPRPIPFPTFDRDAWFGFERSSFDTSTARVRESRCFRPCLDRRASRVRHVQVVPRPAVFLSVPLFASGSKGRKIRV